MFQKLLSLEGIIFQLEKQLFLRTKKKKGNELIGSGKNLKISIKVMKFLGSLSVVSSTFLKVHSHAKNATTNLADQQAKIK